MQARRRIGDAGHKVKLLVVGGISVLNQSVPINFSQSNKDQKAKPDRESIAKMPRQNHPGSGKTKWKENNRILVES